MAPTTVFWPRDISTGGFCYGWTAPSTCVIGCLPATTSTEAQKTLEQIAALPAYQALVPSCGGHPVVLGEFNFEGNRLMLHFLTREYNIIYYRRHNPNSLRFYTMGAVNATPSPKLGSDMFMLPSSDPPQGMSDIVINQFNAAQTLDALVQQHLHPTSRPKTDVLWQIFDAAWTYAAPLLAGTSNALYALCSIPVLKDVSATVQQLDVRAEQAAFFASEVKLLRQRGLTSTPAFSTRYTNFFNIIWLLLNDITIGSALGTFLCDNHLPLARLLTTTTQALLIDSLQWALLWLDSWPAGLKLNTELSAFYSGTFVGCVELWGNVLRASAPYVSTLVYVVGLASAGGASLGISLASDVLAVATVHIYVCYVVSNFVYARFLGTVGGLGGLFRGKRYNVLRHRTDAWEYEIDQLLFGTILFTLVAFLFPTVLAYYSLFAFMRLATILLQACLETQLAFMNHFPLFALMLRAKDEGRIPGGIYFSFSDAGGDGDGVEVCVESQPLPFTTIFFQYGRLLTRLAAHYNPLRLLWQLVSGRLVEPIPRYEIRYSKSVG